MINSLATMPVATLQDIYQLVGVMSATSAYPGEISQESQVVPSIY